jgi:cell division protein FtsN
MIPKYLVVAAFLISTAAPVSAQSVKAGIDAWQRSDYAGAVAIWRPLADKGDADAEFNLGQAYRLGRGVSTNLAAAKSWFERAATQGHVDAQTTLGLLLFQSGNQAQGVKWLEKAAEKGEPRALLVYGTALVNGDSVTQDPIRGYAYVSRAAAQGLAPAKQTLAQLDQIMPLPDREKGVALALSLTKTTAKSSPTPAPDKAEPKPVKTAKAKPSESKPAESKPVTRTAEVRSAEATPPRQAAATGRWRIQLGAFSKRSSAEALYRTLSSNPAVAGRSASYIPAGAVTRLQVGPFESKEAADRACKALGKACFPVPPK